MRRAPVRAPTILTPDEVREIFKAIRKPDVNYSPGRIRLMLGFLYRHGLRVNEACHLKLEDIDLARNAMFVAHGKGGKVRTLGLDPVVKEWLVKWVDRLGITQGRIFMTAEGRPWHRTKVNPAITNLVRRTTITKRVHPHCFRHTFAYELAMKGTPMPLIQKMMGHASLETTSIYLDHVAPELIIKTMEERTWDL